MNSYRNRALALLKIINRLRDRIEDLECKLVQTHNACGVCFTISWAPCHIDTPGAVSDGSGGWMVCGYCRLAKGLTRRRGQRDEVSCRDEI